MAEQKVSLNLLGLPISLGFKRMKYARIRINKDCEISVSVPRSYTAAQAKDFILKHESWILQTLERLQSKLLASDQVRILGKIYKLKFSREVELGTSCGANEVLCNDSARSRVDDDASDGAGSVNSAHLQSGAGMGGSGINGGDVSGSANNATGGMGDGACGGTGSEILKFHSGERTSQSGAAGENLKFNLPNDAAQGLAQQSEMRQGGGFIDTAARNGAADADLEFNLAREDASPEGGEILKFDPATRDGILNFKPVANGGISKFSFGVSKRISKAASENVPQNVAQSAQAEECDEPDFIIKNFIQSSKFKDKIFMSRDAIFCESEGEFAAFKKAFALELYLRYIEKFSSRIDRRSRGCGCAKCRRAGAAVTTLRAISTSR